MPGSAGAGCTLRRRTALIAASAGYARTVCREPQQTAAFRALWSRIATTGYGPAGGVIGWRRTSDGGRRREEAGSELAGERQLLGSGDRVVRGQHEREPNAVVLEVFERQVAHAGVLVVLRGDGRAV
jgi:hypothetical protein